MANIIVWHALSCHTLGYTLSFLSVDLADNTPRCPEDICQITPFLFVHKWLSFLIYCPPLPGSNESFDQTPGEHPLLLSYPSGSLKMPLPTICVPLFFGNLTQIKQLFVEFCITIFKDQLKVKMKPKNIVTLIMDQNMEMYFCADLD